MRSLTLAVLPLLALGCTQPHVPAERPANACEQGAFPRSEMVLEVTVDGRERRALVWMPPQAGPKPVVVNLHEFRSNPRQQVRYSGWADHVAGSGAILVAPDGKYATWNAGECCGRSVTKRVNDVAYLDAIIAELDKVACTNGDVLATGIGNGGMMAEMWSCESEEPTAVVSVGGSLQWHECRNKTPVPVLHYHGSADTFVPIDASPTGLAAQEGIERTVDHATQLWVARNHAKQASPIQAGDLTCERWIGADATRSAEVARCIIQGGKDVWPGAPDGQVDSSNPLANATTGAWAWVQAQWKARDAALEAAAQGESTPQARPGEATAKQAGESDDTDAPSGTPASTDGTDGTDDTDAPSSGAASTNTTDDTDAAGGSTE